MSEQAPIPVWIKRVVSGCISLFLAWFSIPSLLFWYNISNKIDGVFDGSWANTFRPLIFQLVVLMVALLLIGFFAGLLLGYLSLGSIATGLIIGINAALFLPAIVFGVLFLISIPFYNAIKIMDGDTSITGNQVGGWLIGFGIVQVAFSSITICCSGCTLCISECDDGARLKQMSNIYKQISSLITGAGTLMMGIRSKGFIDSDFDTETTVVYVVAPILYAFLIECIYSTVGGFVKSSYTGIVAADDYNGVVGILTFVFSNIFNILLTFWKIMSLIGYLTLARWADSPNSYTGFQVVWYHYPAHFLFTIMAIVFMIYAFFPRFGSSESSDIEAQTNSNTGIFDTLFNGIVPDVVASNSSKIESLSDLLWTPTENGAVSTTGSKKPEDREAKDGDESCKVCMTNVTNTVLIPCKHQVSCFGCSEKLKDCPICRRKIDSFLPVFKA